MAKIVAGCGQKPRFGDTGPLGLILRPSEFLLGPLPIGDVLDNPGVTPHPALVVPQRSDRREAQNRVPSLRVRQPSPS